MMYNHVFVSNFFLQMHLHNLQCNVYCYDSSYASSLIAMLIVMLMTMLMTILRTIVDRLSLEHRLVLKSILFKISLCSSESYK